MLAERPEKQCCVFDTVSLVRFCQLELRFRRAVEWLIDDFYVCVPQKVFEEGRLQLTSTEERKVYFKLVRPWVVYDRNHNYDSVFGRHVDRLSSQEKSSIDEGEAKAAAFALELSRIYNQYVVLVTDDYKAIPSLEKILRNDQVGLVKDSYELLLFLFSRHPKEIPLGELEAALRELTRLLRNNALPAAEEQVPDTRLLEYLRLIWENRLSLKLLDDRNEESKLQR